MENAEIENRHVGIVIGDTGVDKFSFIIRTDLPEDEKPLIGDIVKVETPLEIIYGIIVDIVIRTIDPLQLGKDYMAIEYFINRIKQSEQHQLAKVQILGALKRFEKSNRLERPLYPPSPGLKVYIPSKEELEKMYGKEQGKESRYIEIGKLLGFRKDVSPALNKIEIIIKHMAIFGMTGAGKSHTVAVAVKELSKSGIPVIIFDIHRDYISTFGEKGVIFTFSEEERNYLKNYLNVPGEVNIVKFSLREVRNILPEILGISFQRTSRMYSLLLELLQKEQAETINGLLEKVESKATISTLDTADERARIGLIRRIKVMSSYKIFKKTEEDMNYPDLLDILQTDIVKFLDEQTISDTQIMDMKLKALLNLQGKKYTSFISPGQVTIIDMFPLTLEEQKIVLYLIMNKIFELWKDLKKLGHPIPLVLVVEEAHRFTTGSSLSSKVMGIIAREGRKFGLGLWIVSQMPSKVSEEIVSQANTFILHRLTNPRDLKFIEAVCPYLSKEYLTSITKFERGEAIIVGLGVRYPVMIKVNPDAKIGGSEKEIVEMIDKLYYSTEEQNETDWNY